MTDYKVGDAVQIGGLTWYVLDLGKGDWGSHSRGAEVLLGTENRREIYGGGLRATPDELDLMGARVVPKPIQWQDGDVVLETEPEFPALYKRIDSTWYATGSDGMYDDDDIKRLIANGTAKRVKVVDVDE
jgi:hypothetical protein